MYNKLVKHRKIIYYKVKTYKRLIFNHFLIVHMVRIVFFCRQLILANKYHARLNWLAITQTHHC